MTTGGAFPRVEVVALRPSTHPGNVKAYVTVRLGPVLICGFKIVQQAGQRAWVAEPQIERGGRYWRVVVIENPDLWAHVRATILDHWQGQGQLAL
jgi:hypothetical protein